MCRKLVKNIVKAITPPIFVSWARLVLSLNSNRFTGNYSSWQDASDAANGYDNPSILNKVRSSSLKVKHGEAVFERDSVCFYHEEYRWPTLACLLRVAAENGGRLRVIDFGGALGSFYYQHRKHFDNLKKVRWSVVEQDHYVACGQDEFQDDVLQFYNTINDCLAEGEVDIILCSSVLQYLEKPYVMLETFFKSKIKYILLDRTLFIETNKNRLTVQTVPASIYSASYPAWFFSLVQFKRELERIGLYEVTSFDTEEDLEIGESKGLLLAHI